MSAEQGSASAWVRHGMARLRARVDLDALLARRREALAARERADDAVAKAKAALEALRAACPHEQVFEHRGRRACVLCAFDEFSETGDSDGWRTLVERGRRVRKVDLDDLTAALALGPLEAELVPRRPEAR